MTEYQKLEPGKLDIFYCKYSFRDSSNSALLITKLPKFKTLYATYSDKNGWLWDSNAIERDANEHDVDDHLPG